MNPCRQCHQVTLKFQNPASSVTAQPGPAKAQPGPKDLKFHLDLGLCRQKLLIHGHLQIGSFQNYLMCQYQFLGSFSADFLHMLMPKHQIVTYQAIDCKQGLQYMKLTSRS